MMATVSASHDFCERFPDVRDSCSGVSHGRYPDRFS